MSFVKLVVGAIVALLVLVAVAGFVGTAGRKDDVAGGRQMIQRGYFQDAARNRVFTIEVAPDATPADVRHYADGLAYTPGHVTGAYFYTAGSRMPVDGVTLARDVFAANAALDTPGLSRYAYAYVRGLSGAVEFADCIATPSDSLCVSSR